MKPELRAALQEHKAPSHASKRAIHDQLSPILTAVAQVQRQVATWRERWLAAELADDSVVGDAERMHQTFSALDRQTKDIVKLGRELANTMAQAERYAADIDKLYANKP